MVSINDGGSDGSDKLLCACDTTKIMQINRNNNGNKNSMQCFQDYSLLEVLMIFFLLVSFVNSRFVNRKSLNRATARWFYLREIGD